MGGTQIGFGLGRAVGTFSLSAYVNPLSENVNV